MTIDLRSGDVFPGKTGSLHLADLPNPGVDDVSDGRGYWSRYYASGWTGRTRRKSALKVFVKVGNL